MNILQDIFFIVSAPLSLVCILFAASYLSAIVGAQKWRKMLFASGLFVLLVASQPYTADVLLYPLEHNTENQTINSEKASATYIFTPACYYSTMGTVSEMSRWSSCSLQRLVRASQLSRELNIPIIVTGGNFLHDPAINYAEKAYELLRSVGIDEHQLIMVPQGTDTASEVEAVKQYLNESDVVLVTSATHIDRTRQLLKAYCKKVYSAPVDYHSSGSLSPFVERPSTNAMQRVERAIYEYGARIKHWLIH